MLQEEVTQVDHVQDGNEAATGRKAYVLTEIIMWESRLKQKLHEPSQAQMQHFCWRCTPVLCGTSLRLNVCSDEGGKSTVNCGGTHETTNTNLHVADWLTDDSWFTCEVRSVTVWITLPAYRALPPGTNDAFRHKITANKNLTTPAILHLFRYVNKQHAVTITLFSNTL